MRIVPEGDRSEITLTRTLMLRIIKGIQPPMSWGEERFVEFTGNQHNPEHAWKMCYIEELDDKTLLAFYLKLCDAEKIPVV